MLVWAQVGVGTGVDNDVFVFWHFGTFDPLNGIFGASNKYKTRREFAKESNEGIFKIWKLRHFEI